MIVPIVTVVNNRNRYLFARDHCTRYGSHGGPCAVVQVGVFRSEAEKEKRLPERGPEGMVVLGAQSTPYLRELDFHAGHTQERPYQRDGPDSIYPFKEWHGLYHDDEGAGG